jgi:hypothetical protein
MAETTYVQTSQLNLRRLWLVFTSGPIVWSVHFLAIWVFTEFGCASTLSTFNLAGLDGVTLAVIIVTMIALGLLIWATIAAFAMRGEKPTDDNATYGLKHFLADTGWIMNALFIAVTIVTAFPVIWFSSCASVNFFG